MDAALARFTESASPQAKRDPVAAMFDSKPYRNRAMSSRAFTKKNPNILCSMQDTPIPETPHTRRAVNGQTLANFRELALPVLLEPPDRAPERAVGEVVHGHFEIPALVLRVHGLERQTDDRTEGRAGCRLWQARDPEGMAAPHLTAENACGQFLDPGDLARPAGEDDALPGRYWNPAASRTERASSRISSTRGRMIPISSAREMWRRSAPPPRPGISMRSRSSMPVAMRPPFRVFSRSATCRGTPKRLGNVAGDVFAADPNGVGKDHLAAEEDGDACGAAAKVNRGRSELLFVFDKAESPPHKARVPRHKARDHSGGCTA